MTMTNSYRYRSRRGRAPPQLALHSIIIINPMKGYSNGSNEQQR